MAFWGDYLKPNEPYTLHYHDDVVPKRLRVTQATLGDATRHSPARSIVRCSVGDQPAIAICSLSVRELICCQLELEFEESHDVVFSVMGPRGVYLAGYLITPAPTSCRFSIDNTGQEKATAETAGCNDHDLLEGEPDSIKTCILLAYSLEWARPNGLNQIKGWLTSYKEEYDIWAMEMEHYLEYNLTREHMRRFHGMDDAKEIWEAIRTRFGGNANSKKMQKAVFKQQFEAFRISNSEGLEKGYDRVDQSSILSQLEAHGAEVSTEDANHKFLRSLPSAWSNLAMTMRTNPEIDNLSIDDLYNNLRVFEQEIQGASKTSSSAQNVAL
ncbi:peptidyl-prolyl cis-trans isomerase FKBP43-like protein [Tanacetum coccineum]